MSEKEHEPVVSSATGTVPLQYSGSVFTMSKEDFAVFATLVEADLQRIRAIVAEEVAKALKEAKSDD